MVNLETKSNEVYVVNDGKMTGPVSVEEAKSIADREGLDLIQVGSREGIPVCKVIDYAKYMYEQKKKAKKNSCKKQELKEIRMNDGISKHDAEIKVRNIERILQEGDKVRVVIVYKGRLSQFIDRGVDKLNELKGMIGVAYNLDREPKIEGKSVAMIVSPRSK